MKLFNKGDIKFLLEKEGFVFKKSMGQNFLVDPNVSPRMAAIAANEDTDVIEIGPGAGVLTKELSKRARRVIAIELDGKLKPVLEKTMGTAENVRIIFGDVLKTDLHTVIKEGFPDFKRVTVCANLPYYITSPIIMKLLKERLPIDSITVMVQKEAGERICAKTGSRKAGAVTAQINYYAVARPLFFVPRDSFFPQPKVDSEVISLEIRKTPAVSVTDEEFFFKTINACFMLRRKTAVNSISVALGIEKKTVMSVLDSLSIPETARGEAFDMDTLAALSEKLKCVI